MQTTSFWIERVRNFAANKFRNLLVYYQLGLKSKFDLNLLSNRVGDALIEPIIGELLSSTSVHTVTTQTFHPRFELGVI